MRGEKERPFVEAIESPPCANRTHNFRLCQYVSREPTYLISLTLVSQTERKSEIHVDRAGNIQK